MSKHTPGPWEYLTETTYAGDYPYSVGHKVKIGNEILTISCHGYEADKFFEEAAANARLIAAAPEMAEVLKEYEKWEAALILDDEAWPGAMPTLTYELYDWMIRLQGKRNAALAKAEGVADR